MRCFSVFVPSEEHLEATSVFFALLVLAAAASGVAV